MGQSDLWEQLDRSRGYGDVFDVVKRAVKKVLGLKRSGLMLYIGDLPLHVGAFHQIGSNGIVLNRRILDAFSRSRHSIAELNSFVFALLLHEYLHSLGYLDEENVRSLVHRISLDIFGANHSAVQMAMSLPLPKIFPSDLHNKSLEPILELIKDFERSNQPYIA